MRGRHEFSRWQRDVVYSMPERAGSVHLLHMLCVRFRINGLLVSNDWDV